MSGVALTEGGMCILDVSEQEILVDYKVIWCNYFINLIWKIYSYPINSLYKQIVMEITAYLGKYICSYSDSRWGALW